MADCELRLRLLVVLGRPWLDLIIWLGGCQSRVSLRAHLLRAEAQRSVTKVQVSSFFDERFEFRLFCLC